LGDQPGLNSENEPVYMLNGQQVEMRTGLGGWIAHASYLSAAARKCLRWALQQGPTFNFCSPEQNWAEVFNYSVARCSKVLEELQAVGHAFDVRAPDRGRYRGREILWKFSERPCGLPADELRNKSYTTCEMQFAIHGERAQPGCSIYRSSGPLYLGQEVAKLNGILPPCAVDWFARKNAKGSSKKLPLPLNPWAECDSNGIDFAVRVTALGPLF
jgi:hypothetical protein